MTITMMITTMMTMPVEVMVVVMLVVVMMMIMIMMMYHTVIAHRARDNYDVCRARRRLLLVADVVVNHVPAVRSTRRQALVFVVFFPTFFVIRLTLS